jgi:hypothetical protein
MKPNPLKMLALLFSVSAAGFYVWHASRKDPAQSQKPVPVTQADDFTEPLAGLDVTGKERETATDNNQPETLMRSTKSIDAILRKDDVKQLAAPPGEPEKNTNTQPSRK